MNIFKYIFYNDLFSNDTCHKNIDILIYSLFFRSITTQLTIIPTCMTKPTKAPTNVYTEAFVSTHDLIYSGHTLVFLFFGKLIEVEYTKNILLFTIGKVIQYIFPVTLIVARQHYTIDVVVAIIMYNYFASI